MSLVLPFMLGAFASGSAVMAVGGVTLALMGREANLADNLPTALGDANPISAFTRISLIVAGALKSRGIYPHELALVCTVVGTLILTSVVLIATGNAKSEIGTAFLVAIPVLASACVVYVGMPTFSTSTHQVIPL